MEMTHNGELDYGFTAGESPSACYRLKSPPFCGLASGFCCRSREGTMKRDGRMSAGAGLSKEVNR